MVVSCHCLEEVDLFCTVIKFCLSSLERLAAVFVRVCVCVCVCACVCACVYV